MIIDNVYNCYYSELIGFFGFFELIDDVDVLVVFFNEVYNWFSEYDVYMMCGLVNFLLNYECGLFVDGFDLLLIFMMIYNFLYYL